MYAVSLISHNTHNTAPAAAIGVLLSLTALDARQNDP
jgi:hypothetical protein